MNCQLGAPGHKVSHHKTRHTHMRSPAGPQWTDPKSRWGRNSVATTNHPGLLDLNIPKYFYKNMFPQSFSGLNLKKLYSKITWHVSVFFDVLVLLTNWADSDPQKVSVSAASPCHLMRTSFLRPLGMQELQQFFGGILSSWMILWGIYLDDFLDLDDSKIWIINI